MMYVMISRVVLEKQMEDIARQPESTVIINGFDDREAEESPTLGFWEAEIRVHLGW